MNNEKSNARKTRNVQYFQISMFCQSMTLIKRRLKTKQPPVAQTAVSCKNARVF